MGTNELSSTLSMSNYRLFRHKISIIALPPAHHYSARKALRAQVLVRRGRAQRCARRSNARWRRTPVQGNHYYVVDLQSEKQVVHGWQMSLEIRCRLVFTPHSSPRSD
ncbi:MAG: hypothetical protein H6645_05420 [Caldilineaceae bacterium]|nr:hypothetical protein [Caldilineaceae bacterium]